MQRSGTVALGLIAAAAITLGAVAVGRSRGAADVCNVTSVNTCRSTANGGRGVRELIQDRTWVRRGCRAVDAELLGKTITCYGYDNVYLQDDSGDTSAALALLILAVNCVGLAGVAYVAAAPSARAPPYSHQPDEFT